MNATADPLPGSFESPAEIEVPPNAPEQPLLDERALREREYEEMAERKREEAVHEAREAVWNGRRLEPYSMGRESLLTRLVAKDVPCRPLEELFTLQAWLEVEQTHNEATREFTLGTLCELSEYLPTAAKILYLCSTKPEAWDHLRAFHGKFIRTIEAWTDENIQPHQIEEACLLAVKIRYAYRTALAMPAPRKGGGKGSDAGN